MMLDGLAAETLVPPGNAESADLSHGNGSLSRQLGKIDLFHGLKHDDLIRIERASSSRRYAAQEQIIDRDAPNSDVFIVIEGRVRVVNYSLAGREITFDELQPGCYFGEIAAIDGRPRSASVLAVEDSLVVAVPRRTFMEVISRHPGAALRVMQRLALIIRSADERIMDLSTLAAYNRVHAEVLRQARLQRVDSNTARLRPIPLHGDIASRVSTTRETVARAMNDLARKGLVERTKDALVIRDLERFESLVEEVRG